MRKKICTLSFLIMSMLFNNTITFSQALAFDWANQMGGPGQDYGLSITIDYEGNVLTTGFFELTGDFDSGLNTYNLTSNGFEDIFIQKTDANGNFLWAKSMGSIRHDDKGVSIVTDANGNVYTTGSFSDTVDFDPSLVDTFNLISNGSSDIFIQKLDANGNFIWAKQIGGTATDFGNFISLDANENIYLTGHFTNTVDFDPDTANVFNLIAGNSGDAFLLKLDPGGNFKWVKQEGGSNVMGNGIKTDILGNIYLTNNNCSYIEKLDSMGNTIWLRQLNQGGNKALGLTLDANANMYITGAFIGTQDFDPSPQVFSLTSNGNEDIFILKLDSAGNFLYAKNIGGIAYDEGHGITTDINGNVYVTGWFGGSQPGSTVDFDPGAGTYYLTSVNLSDIFILKLDSAGNFIWAGQMSGSDIEVGLSIAVNYDGDVYSTGFFYSTVDFDPGNGIFNLISAGNQEVYVQKLSTIVGIAEQNNYSNPITLFPNPTTSQINITSTFTIDKIEITDVIGQVVYRATPNQKNISVQMEREGIYFVSLTSNNQVVTRKLVVEK